MENAKQWYQSKTFWLNLIGLVLAVISLAAQSFPLDPKVVAFVLGLGNIILRFLDGQPIMVGKKMFGLQTKS